jgi:hypothetical protein
VKLWPGECGQTSLGFQRDVLHSETPLKKMSLPLIGCSWFLPGQSHCHWFAPILLTWYGFAFVIMEDILLSLAPAQPARLRTEGNQFVTTPISAIRLVFATQTSCAGGAPLRMKMSNAEMGEAISAPMTDSLMIRYTRPGAASTKTT